MIAVALAATYFVARDSTTGAIQQIEKLPLKSTLEHRNNANEINTSIDQRHEDSATDVESAAESNSDFRLARSVYDADRDFRQAAIAAVEKEMNQRLATYPDGWIRWQPVWIDPFEFTSGDFLNENAVAREFIVSPFPDRTYRATRTEYRPRSKSGSASWFGVLDDGESGTIEINVQATLKGPELRIRLRTPDGHFNIMPTEIYGAYVAGEPNQVFWMEQVVVQ